MNTARTITAALALSLAATLPALAQDTTLAILTFENNSIADVSGHVATALVGSPTFGVGTEGGCLTTAGNNGVSLNLNINPSVRPQITMGGWVRPTNGTPVRHFISHDNQGYDRDVGIDNRGGGIGWSAFTGSGILGYIPVTLNQWQFVAVVYDDTAQTVLLYVDGVTRSVSGRRPGAGSTSVRVGMSTCCDAGIIGDIDGVFILAEALTVARLDEIRAGGIHKAPTCPAFLSNPSTRAVCPSGSAMFSVDAAGSGTLAYRWRKGGVPLNDESGHISGALTPTLTLINCAAGDAGSYDCLVSNACAPAGFASAAAALTVSCQNKADVAGLGGTPKCDGALTADDIVVYLDAFFANNLPIADIASLGGGTNPDGRLTPDDLIVFLAAFFAGCP